jgi:hypothetical protein
VTGCPQGRLSLRTFEAGTIPTSIVDRCTAKCASPAHFFLWAGASMKGAPTSYRPQEVVGKPKLSRVSRRNQKIARSMQLELCTFGLTELSVFATIWQILGETLVSRGGKEMK